MDNRSADKRHTIVRILFDELYKNYQYLWMANYEESGFLSKGFYEVDVDRYKLLEASGKLFVVGVKVANEVVGYAVVVIDRFLHSRSVMFGKIDCIFIDKEYRNYECVKDLTKFIEDQLRVYNIKYLFVSSMVKKSLDTLFVRLKYQPTEMVYCKEL
jgi:ribosomal protein S18 acetylase RimI-like enzyme